MDRSGNILPIGKHPLRNNLKAKPALKAPPTPQKSLDTLNPPKPPQLIHPPIPTIIPPIRVEAAKSLQFPHSEHNQKHIFIVAVQSELFIGCCDGNPIQ